MNDHRGGFKRKRDGDLEMEYLLERSEFSIIEIGFYNKIFYRINDWGGFLSNLRGKKQYLDRSKVSLLWRMMNQVGCSKFGKNVASLLCL